VDYVCQIYSAAQRDQWLADNDARLVDQRFYRAFTGSSWAAEERVDPPKEVAVGAIHQLSCLTLTV